MFAWPPSIMVGLQQFGRILVMTVLDTAFLAGVLMCQEQRLMPTTFKSTLQSQDFCVMSWFSDFLGSGGIDWSAVLPADA